MKFQKIFLPALASFFAIGTTHACWADTTLKCSVSTTQTSEGASKAVGATELYYKISDYEISTWDSSDLTWGSLCRHSGDCSMEPGNISVYYQSPIKSPDGKPYFTRSISVDRQSGAIIDNIDGFNSITNVRMLTRYEGYCVPGELPPQAAPKF